MLLFQDSAMAVKCQYHQNTMHESVSKDEFVTFAVKDILLDHMATMPERKIEQAMAMILGKIMFPCYMQLPR